MSTPESPDDLERVPGCIAENLGLRVFLAGISTKSLPGLVYLGFGGAVDDLGHRAGL
jgi:hypothetical protein